MNRAELLKSYLPKYYRRSLVVDNFNYANAYELDLINKKIDENIKELIINSADKSLARWEKEFGLISDSTMDINIRRSRILAKYLMRPPCTIKTLKNIIRAFTYDVDINEHYEDYCFDVILKTKEPIGDKLKYIDEVVEEIKPAHLGFTLALNYLTKLIILSEFTKWHSEELNVCGTIDTSKEKYIETDGWSFSTNIKIKSIGYVSEEFLVASESTFVTNTYGKSLSQNLISNIKRWESDEFNITSESNFVNSTMGDIINNLIKTSIHSNISEKFKQVSEDTILGGE